MMLICTNLAGSTSNGKSMTPGMSLELHLGKPLADQRPFLPPRGNQ